MSLDLQKILKELKKYKLPSENRIEKLCWQVKEVLLEEPNLSELSSPIIVIADIHGQFEDLLEMIDFAENYPDSKIVFLGNYVNRGQRSIEVMLFLMIFKLMYPNNIYLLRGNHETRQISMIYGMYEECLKKFGNDNVWRYMNELFDFLPICSLIDDQHFCVHGGISEKIKHLDDIRKIERINEVIGDGAFCDLLWSDPFEGNGWSLSERGMGHKFGKDVFDKFMNDNGLKSMIRGNQVSNEGHFQIWEDRLVSLWSAPSFGSERHNFGAFLHISGNDEFQFTKFKKSQIPRFGEITGNQKLPIMNYLI